MQPMFGEYHGTRSKTLDRKVISTEAALPSFEEEIVDANGTKRVFLTTKTPLRDCANAVVGVLTSSLDITDRKRAENHLFYMAHHDVLTGLPNRALLTDRLRREIARTRRGDRPFALHLIDLDGFKDINDGLGHQVGDLFLVEVAERLRSLVRETDTIARLGGDEFAVLQTHVMRNEDVANLATRITEAIGAPWVHAGKRVISGASVGISFSPHRRLRCPGASAQQRPGNVSGQARRRQRVPLLCLGHEPAGARGPDPRYRFARGHRRGGNSSCTTSRRSSLSSGQVVGAEALLRWQRPGHGLVGPAEFLARAEKNGLIIPINEWVLREACREAKTWQRRGQPPIRVGVNLSSLQFLKKNVPLLVAQGPGRHRARSASCSISS